jgi:hypothetical protein
MTDQSTELRRSKSAAVSIGLSTHSLQVRITHDRLDSAIDTLVMNSRQSMAIVVKDL